MLVYGDGARDPTNLVKGSRVKVGPGGGLGTGELQQMGGVLNV